MTAIRVLLVDDAADFLHSACAFLERLPGVQLVGMAMSGTEAVELALRLAPDLVLMDMMMPGMSGLAATTLIKMRPKPPRVVIVTLHDNPEYRLAAESALADGYVCKSDFTTAVPAITGALFAGSGVTGRVE